METTGGIIRCGGAAYVLLGLLLLTTLTRISALSVTVNDVECIYEYVLYEGDTVSGNFVVVDHDIFWSSDHPGIDFTATSPAGNIVHTLKGTSGDKFEFKAPKSGMYKFCFHNPYSTPETVSFYIHVGHIPTEHDLAKDEHLDPINVKLAELKEALESVTAEQKYLKARDTRHRHTNESTRRRVIFYTVAEYLLLALVNPERRTMLAVFNKSVAKSPVELQQSPQNGAVSALKDGFLATHFSSTHSGSFVINLASSGFFAYSSSRQNPLLPRLFAVADDMFCLFEGHIENIAALKQQYGLNKTANEVSIVIEAYRTLRDRGPYPAEQVVRGIAGRFAFVLFDATSQSTFIASDVDGSVPFLWGTDAEGHLVVSTDTEIVKQGCGKSSSPFPKGILS
ncbi:hypothetical protein SASPL_103864 [Salvia splendens]|uniref:GOLD domain-containing protein n=1 Tax=Salvia splendens TaxID=180675 RepID=A0A8X8YI73_SALSN|nr:hypothetical protein SASPL_103864 [Salvia splendens]